KVCELLPIQRRPHELVRVIVIDPGWRRKRHPASPIFRSFRVNPAQNDPPATDVPLDDCRSPIRILRQNITPTCKLRSILPILLERRSIGAGHGNCSLANPAILCGEEAKPHAGSQIQSVVRRVPGYESTCANPEIIQSALDGVPNL